MQPMQETDIQNPREDPKTNPGLTPKAEIPPIVSETVGERNISGAETWNCEATFTGGGPPGSAIAVSRLGYQWPQVLGGGRSVLQFAGMSFPDTTQCLITMGS